MRRRAPLLFVLPACLALAELLEEAALPAAEGDDECLVAGAGDCAISALQRRGSRSSSRQPEVDERGIELRETEDFEDPAAEDPAAEEPEDTGGQSTISAGRKKKKKKLGPDISKEEQWLMLERIDRHTRSAAEMQEDTMSLEDSVNDIYVMTMKELSPGKKIIKPIAPASIAVDDDEEGIQLIKTRRRRRRRRAVTLPKRMREVDSRIKNCDNMVKGLWGRVKKCSDILVFTKLRIKGRVIQDIAIMNSTDGPALADEALATSSFISHLGEEIREEEQQAPDTDVEEQRDREEDSEMLLGREDLEVRIEQMGAELVDLERRLNEVTEKEEQTRQLFKDTFRLD